MVSTVYTGSTIGIDGYSIEVQVDLLNSLPGIVIVGLPDTAVGEAKERVKSAIKNSGFVFPTKKIVINMAPADIRKEGSAFDLPIAVAVLASAGYVNLPDVPDTCMIGELSLDGSLRPINGVLSIAFSAQNNGLKRIIVPFENGKEASLVEGIDIYPVKNLLEAIDVIQGSSKLSPLVFDKEKFWNNNKKLDPNIPDFSDVKGQEHVKRTLEIAAAGGHNLLMSGSPGSGKSMLAKAFSGILPSLEYSEAIEVSKIYSVSGLTNSKGLITDRPFRSPHHTASSVGIIGGGNMPKPGEISLANRGVLFLDEVVEFPRNVLEVLRQPLEDKVVTISRAQLSVTYPADFILLLAMNPCPCGFRGDTIKKCICSNKKVQQYWSKLSGPLLDRIDLQIEVTRLDEREILGYAPSGDSTSTIKARVEKARTIQVNRFKGIGIVCNSQMNSKLIREHCKLNKETEDFLLAAIRKMELSARAYDRILRVSRSIADLSVSNNLELQHIAEALQYRNISTFV